MMKMPLTNPYLRPVLLALVLLLGTLVRVAQFSRIPPGLNVDEASSAYEAYSLAETGKDRWGNELPAYFPGWGSGQNVLLAYLTVPVVKACGLSVFSARIVMLALSLFTLPLLFFALRPLGWLPAWLSALLLAVVPWHFMLSRWALESNLVPFCMVLGCLLLSRALITQRRRWIIPSLLPFALSLYAYGTTVVVLPVMLGLVLGLAWAQVQPRWPSWLLAAGLAALVATPFLLFFSENYLLHRNLAWTDHLFFSTSLLPSNRFSQVSDDSWVNIVGGNLHFLVAGFNDGTYYNMLPNFKPLLSFTVPFTLVAGLIAAWKLARRRGRFARSPQNLVLLVFAAWGLGSTGLFLSVILNINRFNHAYVPCLVLAVWAATLVIDSFGPTVPRPLLRLGLAAWLLVEGGLAGYVYFARYPQGPVRVLFSDGLGEAFAAAAKLKGISQVRITDRLPMPYVYALFYLRYPPARFQREAKVEVDGDTYRVHRFGRYVFDQESMQAGQPYGYLAHHREILPAAGQHGAVVFSNELWEVGVITPAK